MAVQLLHQIDKRFFVFFQVVDLEQYLMGLFAILQFYLLTMTETPYELLMRKERERKNQLLSNIQTKDLKHRSISYNLKINSDNSPDPEAKMAQKQKHTRMSFANCLKKSFYYRKFFNKSIEGQFTSQQFHKFKQKINKVNSQNGSVDKQPALFKQILENSIHRKYSLKDGEEKGLQITIKSKEVEKDKAITLESAGEGKKKTEQKNRKIEDIQEIAEGRKCSLDFDLQIQGNKKSIRIKECSPTKSLKKGKQTQVKESSPQLERRAEAQASGNSNRSNISSKASGQKLQLQNMKPPCTFFKRFQQKNRSTAEESDGVGFKITRIKYNLSNLNKLNQFYTLDEVINPTSYYTCSTPKQDEEQLLIRDIRSSWNSSHDNEPNRYFKVETAENRRVTIRRTKKPQATTFTNDIKGWNVHVDNEQDLPEVF